MSERVDRESDEPRYTIGFWVGFALGAPVVAFGLRGVLAELPGVQLTSFAFWFLGGALIHDLLLAPVVCMLGWISARRLPRSAVAPVQAALVASGIVALVSWPFVRGYGITPGEPSFLSRNYTGSVLVVWTVVWAVAIIAIVMRALNARRR